MKSNITRDESAYNLAMCFAKQLSGMKSNDAKGMKNMMELIAMELKIDAGYQGKYQSPLEAINEICGMCKEAFGPECGSVHCPLSPFHNGEGDDECRIKAIAQYCREDCLDGDDPAYCESNGFAGMAPCGFWPYRLGQNQDSNRGE